MQKREELGTRSVNLHTHSPPVAPVGRTMCRHSVMGPSGYSVTLPGRERVKHRHKHPWYKAVHYNKVVLMKRREEGNEGKD